jgi:NAD(P)-dependent dehydrogenase (short-subunit alcohol dehydrogenase family)
VLAARRSQPLFELADQLGERAQAIPTDVSKPAQVASLIDEAEKQLGRIDVVVNGAGVSNPAPLSELSPTRWQEVISINLSGCFYVCREVGLRMRQAGDDVCGLLRFQGRRSDADQGTSSRTGTQRPG